MRVVDIVIKQAPISVNFTCPYCGEEFEIDYEEFVCDMVQANLGSLLYDNNEFICPHCDGYLVIDETILD